MSQTTVDILYIAVTPPFQRKGIASAMIHYLNQVTCPHELLVTCTFRCKDKSHPLYLLFAEHPECVVEENEGTLFQISYEQLIECKKLDINLPQLHPMKFYELPSYQQKSFFANITEEGHNYNVEQLLNSKNMCTDLCLCMVESEKIVSSIFVQPDHNALHLCFAYCNPKFQKYLIQLLGYLRMILMTHYDKSLILNISAVTQEAEKLVLHLYPSAFVVGNYYLAYSDFEMIREDV